MTELSFLIDLLLNHKLSTATKKHIAARINEVEATHVVYRPSPSAPQMAPVAVPPQLQGQSPSTIQNMMKHGVIPPVAVPPPTEEPQQPAIIAQTPATAAALASRQEAIQQAMSGKVDKFRGRPRKF